MNGSNRNNNEVEYCSRVIYCYKTKHKFKKNSLLLQFDVGKTGVTVAGVSVAGVTVVLLKWGGGGGGGVTVAGVSVVGGNRHSTGEIWKHLLHRKFVN